MTLSVDVSCANDPTRNYLIVLEANALSDKAARRLIRSEASDDKTVESPLLLVDFRFTRGNPDG